MRWMVVVFEQAGSMWICLLVDYELVSIYLIDANHMLHPLLRMSFLFDCAAFAPLCSCYCAYIVLLNVCTETEDIWKHLYLEYEATEYRIKVQSKCE